MIETITTLAGIGLIISYCLLGLAVLLPLYFSILQVTEKPKTTRLVLFAAVGMLALFTVCLIFASPEEGFSEEYDISPFAARLVGAGLMMMYILMAGAIVTIIVTEIRRSRHV